MSEDRFREDAGDDLRAALSDALGEDGDNAATPAPPPGGESAPGAGEERPAVRPVRGAERTGTRDRPRPGDRQPPPIEKQPPPGERQLPTGERQLPTGERQPAAAEGPPQPDDPGAVPAHWSKEDRAVLEGLPEADRAKIVPLFKRMEAGFTPKLQRAARLERDYGALEDVFNPQTREFLKHAGVAEPHQMIRYWAGREAGLLNPQTRIETVGRILQDYGINTREGVGALAGVLNRLAGDGGGNGGGGAAADPFDQRIRALETRFQSAEAARQHQHNIAAQQTVEGFMNATGPDGQPLHPHFAELEHTMTLLAADELGNNRTPNLEDLYQRAARSHPTIGPKLIEAEYDARNSTVADAQRAKVAAARRAGSSIHGSPRTGALPNNEANGLDQSLRENIVAAFGAAGSRGGRI